MATSVHTGWRTVTPGKCFECGESDGWEFWGDGSVTCECQRCPECLEQPGWHAAGCFEAHVDIFDAMPDPADIAVNV